MSGGARNEDDHDLESDAGQADQQRRELQQLVDDLLSERGETRTLEAGCGSAAHIRAPGRGFLVGIDISEEQLRHNTVLDERIQADIQEYDLGEQRYDLVVCWDVLEHLERPVRAVENMAGALEEGGLLVLALPHAMSVKGLITKLVPFRLHVLFFRHVLELSWAGSHLGPYPTHMRLEIRPQALVRTLERLGLTVEYLAVYESWTQRRARRRIGLRGWTWSLFCQLVSFATARRIRADVSDVVLLARRPPAPAVSAGPSYLSAA